LTDFDQPGVPPPPAEGGAPPSQALSSTNGLEQRAPDRGALFSGWRLRLGVSVGFVLVFGVLSLIRVHEIGKPITFDLGNYEYYSGYAELHGFRSAIALPGQLETYLDAQMNTLYYFLITYLSPRAAVSTLAVLQSLPVSLLSFCVFAVARSVAGTRVVPVFAGIVAGGSAFVAPLHITEIGETSSDALLGVFLFAAAALLYRILTATDAHRAQFAGAAIAGVLLGLAGELKATETAFSASIFIAFAVALLLARARTSWTFGRCALLCATVLAPAVVVAGALYLPEAIMLWHRYHDPIFPFMNGIFHSPYLLPKSFNPGYAANSPYSLWFHYTRLFIGGQGGHNSNGLYLLPLRSPVLFFSLPVVAVMLIVDLVKRNKPEAIFIEIAFVAGFLIWAVLYGFYRYLAPLEMAAGGVVIMLVFLHRLHRPALLLSIAVALAVAIQFSDYAEIGAREAFGQSYFGISAAEFSNLSGDGVVMAGDGTLAFIVPDLPANTELVRVGGNLQQVMSNTWWVHVRSIVEQSHRPRWVLFYGGPKGKLNAELEQIGFLTTLQSCHRVPSAEDGVLAVHECQVKLAPISASGIS
jgi:hypothetical protein